MRRRRRGGNNPLKYTDPTGHGFFSDIGEFFDDAWDWFEETMDDAWDYIKENVNFNGDVSTDENLLRLEISATGCVTEINFDIEIFQPQWDNPTWYPIFLLPKLVLNLIQYRFRALPVALLRFQLHFLG